MSKKKKGSQNKLFNNFNAESDDFVLADLNTTEPDQELSPVPLSTFNDDGATIDGLLINSNIESKEGGDEQTLSDDVPLIDEVDVVDDFSNSDRFVVGPIEHEEEPKVEIKDTLSNNNAELKFDKTVEDLYFKDEINPEEITPEAAVRRIRVSINKKPGKPATPEPKKLELSFFGKEKKSYKSEEVGVQIKNAAPINYVVLGLCSAALLFAVFITYEIVHLESQISKLSNIMSVLEEDVSALTEKSSTLGSSNSGSSTVGNTGQENTQAIAPSAPLNKVEETTNPDVKKKLTDPVIEKPVKTKVKKIELPANTTVKTVSLNERPKKIKELLVVNKSVPTSHVLHKVSHYELQKAVKHELQQANKKLALENKKGVKPIITGSHIPKPKEQPSGPGWMVSLIAYEDERFAKRKAARLINQGIPVKVIPIHANKDKWYQLKVGGFKNKESAESYASKVKKSLKLSMVAVSFQ